MRFSKVILVILDGWGYSEAQEHNAISAAKTPFFDALLQNYPHGLLDASGEAIGLPAGQIGTSEVGHLTIGAGAAIDNDLVKISKAIKNKELKNNTALLEVFAHVKKHGSILHLLGLLGPGGVHSHQDHLHALLREAKAVGIEKVAVHVLTDGRDLPPQSAHNFVKHLEEVMEEEKIGFIATATGRFYGMDRDNNWDRIAAAEQALFSCKGRVCHNRKPSQVIEELHKEGIVDEHLEPLIFLDDTGKGYAISKNDAAIFYNFRPDRARQLSAKILEKKKDLNLCFATMTDYGKGAEGALILFPQQLPEATLGEQVSLAGLTQAHIAETEKYAHVTYFLNGGVEALYPGEERALIESRKDIRTHDLAPEMKAAEITDEAFKFIDRGINFIAINYANADMVGHTANFEATVKAVEFLDLQLKRLVEKAKNAGYVVVITADHGNAELNFEKEADHKHTAHTTNLVPIIITDSSLKIKKMGSLADVAPTILEIFKLAKPAVMTGKSLID